MRWFNNLCIRNKFLVIAVVILPFLLGLAGTGVWGVNEINGLLQKGQAQEIPSIYDLGLVRANTQEADNCYRKVTLETDVQKIQTVLDKCKALVTEARKYWELYLLLPAIIEEKVLWSQFESTWKTWQSELDRVGQIILAVTPESARQATGILTNGAGANLVDTLNKLTDINYTGTVRAAQTGQNTFTFVLTIILITGLLVILATGLAGLVLSRSISVPLNKLRTVTQAITAGDLTKKVMLDTKDEVGQLGKDFNMMLASLNELNQEIVQAGHQISGASAELLSMVNQQSSGASEQSAAIHQTTSTVNEVKATTEQTNQRARSMSDTAMRSVTVADEGQQAVVETINSMISIRGQVESIAENILALSEQTQQISEIIATVNDIAEQSNLLALNASVEAARAGEHGRGFNVVANEVRNLAERSKQATAQVRSILGDIQKATNAVVMVTEEGTKGVEHGVNLVDKAGLTIRQLSEVIRENLASTQQIIAVVQQQNVGVEQVAQAMSNINEVTNQNVAATRQLQQSVESMSQLATRFGQLTGRYQLLAKPNTATPNANTWIGNN